MTYEYAFQILVGHGHECIEMGIFDLLHGKSSRESGALGPINHALLHPEPEQTTYLSLGNVLESRVI